jgi:hypothetical protein
LVTRPPGRVTNAPPAIEWDIREQREGLVAARALVSAHGANRQLSVAKPLRSFFNVPPAPWSALRGSGYEVAICQDGREWAMFWLENEVAFVRPGSRQFYKWVQTSIVHSLIPTSARSGYPKFKA